MAPNRDAFGSYILFDQPKKVTIADGTVVDAIGTGNIKVTIRVDRKVTRKTTLLYVLHIPNLTENLFLVKLATDRGMVVQFGHSRCCVKDMFGAVLAMGCQRGKLYYLDLKSSAHSSQLASCNTIWHERLAHINHSTIQRMNR